MLIRRGLANRLTRVHAQMWMQTSHMHAVIQFSWQGTMFHYSSSRSIVTLHFVTGTPIVTDGVFLHDVRRKTVGCDSRIGQNCHEVCEIWGSHGDKYENCLLEIHEICGTTYCLSCPFPPLFLPTPPHPLKSWRVMLLKIQVFWDVMPCRQVNSKRQR